MNLCHIATNLNVSHWNTKKIQLASEVISPIGAALDDLAAASLEAFRLFCPRNFRNLSCDNSAECWMLFHFMAASSSSVSSVTRRQSRFLEFTFVATACFWMDDIFLYASDQKLDHWILHRSQYLIALIPSSLSSFRALQRFFLRPLQAAIWLKSLDAPLCSGIILPAAASWQTQCGLQEKQPQKRHRGPKDYCICWIMPAIRSLLKEKYWFK